MVLKENNFWRRISASRHRQNALSINNKNNNRHYYGQLIILHENTTWKPKQYSGQILKKKKPEPRKAPPRRLPRSSRHSAMLVFTVSMISFVELFKQFLSGKCLDFATSAPLRANIQPQAFHQVDLGVRWWTQKSP